MQEDTKVFKPKMRKRQFLFWSTVEWLYYDDGGVDCYSFGRLTDCNPIHAWLMRRKRWNK